MTTPLRIGIITTSSIARDNISKVVSELTCGEILWAMDSQQLDLSEISTHKPDLVVVGACDEHDQPVTTTELIMNHSPLPILLLCDSVSRHASVIFEAMGKGAIDVVGIRGINDQIDSSESHEICSKFKTIKKLIRTEYHSTTANKKISKPGFPLIAIGASTGGPTALAELLKLLPADIPAAIVIIQHIDEKFSSNLAQWLGTQTDIPVELATAGQEIVAGKVFLAAGSGHLILNESGKLTYTQQPENSAYKPCIDIFFFSVAEYWQAEGIAVLLTGMGSDGAHGLLELQQAGFLTLTQDKDSCAVFGMPAAAVKINAASRIDNPSNIARIIIEKLHLKVDGGISG